MRVATQATELNLSSPLSRSVIVSLAGTGFLALLYIFRSYISDIPPQDHIALSILLCMLLLNTWRMIDLIHVKFSLSHNRCWVSRYRFCTTQRKSVPVSQIHSARLDMCPNPETPAHSSRIVLVTSMGMLPVCDHYFLDVASTKALCLDINNFLASQNDFLAA